jgi:tripeptide aminopeptidase
MPLPPVAERFLRYVQIDTQSDPKAEGTPSTEKQKDLGRLLLGELQAMGLADVVMDDYGFVMATVPATLPPEVAARAPVLALLAHLDTSPDAPGANVRPIVHPQYDGGVLVLPGDPTVVLDPARQPALRRHIGHDLITSDGTTLLGSDDKAGVAVLMQLAADLLADPTVPHPTIRLCFTVDEEIGRGIDRLDLGVLGADVAYTLDGSDVNTISMETFNAVGATITVEGVMVHPGYAKGQMVNAIRILAELLTGLPADEAPETTEGDQGFYHPHQLPAGTAAQAQVKLILRDFDRDGIARRKAFLTRLVARYRRKYPQATIRLELKEQYRNMRSYIEATDPRVLTMAQEAAARMGITLTEERIRGGTDGARLSERGLPTPNIFNGGHDYHSRFEWNTVQNLEHTLAYTKHLVQVWATQVRRAGMPAWGSAEKTAPLPTLA